MSLIKIDHEKCNRDGICVEVCPLSLLVLDPKCGPKLKPGASHICIACGHCVAACPSEAIDNRKSPLSGQTPIPSGFSISPEAAALFLRSRRSIRVYKDEPVPREQMLQLLEIARFAPSGHNSQGISYLVVDGREKVDGLREIVIEWMRRTVNSQPDVANRYHMPAIIRSHEKGEDRVFRGAHQLIVAHASKELAAAPISTYLALEYVEIYAPVLGMGTCWAGYAQACAQQFQPMADFLKIPLENAIMGILMAGYPKHHYYRLPDRNPLDVSWLQTGE